MKVKPKVFVDMDGVVVNLMDYVMQTMNQMHSTRYTVDMVTQFRFLDLFKEFAWSSMLKTFLSPEAFDKAHCPPIKGSLNGLAWLLHDKSLDVYLVTSPWVSNYDCCRKKREWLDHYLPGLFPRNQSKVIFINNKYLLIDSCDFIIDDKPDTLVAYGPRKAIVFNQPWNQQERLDGYKRVSCLDDAHKYICNQLY